MCGDKGVEKELRGAERNGASPPVKLKFANIPKFSPPLSARHAAGG
jgi:hypothetical protein